MEKQKSNKAEVVSRIKDAIRVAREIVDGVPEPYNVEAFRIVLVGLLESIQAPLSIGEVAVPKAEELGKPLLSGFEKLARVCSVPYDQLEDIVDVKDGTVGFLVRLDGGAVVSQRQIVAAQCILVTYLVALNVEWVAATVLAEAIRDAGISTENLSRNLGVRVDIFRKRGKRKLTEYKLTESGKKISLRTIKMLSRGRVQEALKVATKESDKE